MLSVSSRLLSVQKVPASVPLEFRLNVGLASVPVIEIESAVNVFDPTVIDAEVILLPINVLVPYSDELVSELLTLNLMVLSLAFWY